MTQHYSNRANILAQLFTSLVANGPGKYRHFLCVFLSAQIKVLCSIRSYVAKKPAILLTYSTDALEDKVGRRP